MFNLQVWYRKWQSWRSRSPQERSLFLQAYVLLFVVTLALQWKGLRWTQSHLAQRYEPDVSTSNTEWSEHQIIKIVRMAVRYSPWSNCLRKSLVLWGLLRRQGIMSDLRIGMCKHEGEFKAHAWVELDGIVLNDRPNIGQRYIPFQEPIEWVDLSRSTPVSRGGNYR